MPDHFTEQTNIGYGQRLINSFSGVVLGPLLVIGAVMVLYWNEGRINIAKHARNAIEISTQASATHIPDGVLVAASGVVHTSDLIGDNEFIVPGNYLALARNTQIFAWVEKTEEREQKNLGGSVTKEITYTYAQIWTDDARPTSSFKHPEEHDNKQKTITNQWLVASHANIGMYAIDTARLTWPGLNNLPLNAALLKKKIPAVLIADKIAYLFVSRDGKSTYLEPQNGDMRIRYEAIQNDLQGTLFGAIQNNTIMPYIINAKTSVYRLFLGTKQDALNQLQSEHRLMLWLLRLLGFLMMWIGFMIFVGFISVILDVIPLLGSFANTLLGAISFAVAVILSAIVIMVSWIAHTPVILIVLVVASMGVFAIVLWRRAQRKRSV